MVLSVRDGGSLVCDQLVADGLVVGLGCHLSLQYMHLMLESRDVLLLVAHQVYL